MTKIFVKLKFSDFTRTTIERAGLFRISRNYRFTTRRSVLAEWKEDSLNWDRHSVRRNRTGSRAIAVVVDCDLVMRRGAGCSLPDQGEAPAGLAGGASSAEEAVLMRPGCKPMRVGDGRRLCELRFVRDCVAFMRPMRKVNTNNMEELVWSSPKGKFGGAGKQVSEALGRKPFSTDLMERHPFDIEILRIPPGKAAYPYHTHSAQWEFYHVISGRGVARHRMGRHRSNLATPSCLLQMSRTS